MIKTPTSDFPDFPIPAIETAEDSKDRLIDALQAQLREARQEIADVKHFLVITDAKLEESRRALDRSMGFRS